MASIDLGNVWNTGHWSPPPLDLTDLAAVHDLTTATFLAQVRETVGATVVLFEWKTGGSLVTPTNSIAYDNTLKALTLNSLSPALLAAFPVGGNFWWEVGFYLAAAPTDFRRIGTGQFPVNNGVVR
jgi:hypothetical protein